MIALFQPPVVTYMYVYDRQHPARTWICLLSLYLDRKSCPWKLPRGALIPSHPENWTRHRISVFFFVLSSGTVVCFRFHEPCGDPHWALPLLLDDDKYIVCRYVWTPTDRVNLSSSLFFFPVKKNSSLAETHPAQQAVGPVWFSTWLTATGCLANRFPSNWISIPKIPCPRPGPFFRWIPGEDIYSNYGFVM